MKYETINELEHFQFAGAHISEFSQTPGGSFCAILDDVIILPENSCNRDIRMMRANQLTLQLTHANITAIVEEGYKIYDADGNLKEQFDDQPVAPARYPTVLSAFTDCSVDAVERNDSNYTISIDTYDHTYRIELCAKENIVKWDRFLNL